DLGPRLAERPQDASPQPQAAERVVEQAYLDALADLLGQQVHEALAGRIAADNEELEVDMMPSGGDGLEQSVEGFLGIVIGGDRVAGADGEGVDLEGDRAKAAPGLIGRVAGLAAVAGLPGPRRMSAAELGAVTAALVQWAVDALVAEHAEEEGADEGHQDDD